MHTCATGAGRRPASRASAGSIRNSFGPSSPTQTVTIRPREPNVTDAHSERQAREAEGLTQAELARRLGITQPSVARLEAAGDNVSIATLRRALNVMNRTLELRSAKMPSSVDDTQIIEALGLSPGERIERHDHE